MQELKLIKPSREDLIAMNDFFGEGSTRYRSPIFKIAQCEHYTILADEEIRLDEFLKSGAVKCEWRIDDHPVYQTVNMGKMFEPIAERVKALQAPKHPPALHFVTLVVLFAMMVGAVLLGNWLVK